MQTIKRKELINLYKAFDCSDWRSKIKIYLDNSSLESDDYLINIKKEDIEYAKRNASSKQKESLENSGIDLGTNLLKDINNFDDILRKAGKTYEEIVPWKSPKNKAQISQNALAKLQLITEVYNEGVEINFDYKNQYKYYNWFEKKKGGWSVYYCSYDIVFTSLPFGLFFISEEKARDGVKKFLNIYEEYLP